MQLFRDRGWEAIIADDIVSTVLGLLSLIAGLLTAGISVFIASTSSWFDALEAGGEFDKNSILIICGM